MNLTLSQEQAQSLLQLADAALRGGGLQYARQAVQLMDTLDQAATSPPPEEVPDG
ncbi:MAG: hypothetical protein VKN56_08370 [Cyanobacteriota bacterium]|nr:hypothetical protein [Cyanobacteriota bacterium]